MTYYLIRLDDAHAEQHHEKWKQIENLLDKYNIKPIVAVIPKNKDRNLVFGSDIGEAFWDLVKKWEGKGWGIALHGLNHLLTKGNRSIEPISEYSEFSGKSLADQKIMLEKSLNIFFSNGCVPKYFAAPAHGYDQNTLKAIKYLNTPLVVSDSFGFRPYEKGGLKFIPQQLWRGRKFPFGVWTICLHPSNMSDDEFNRLEIFIRKNSAEFQIALNELSFNKYAAIDFFVALIYSKIFIMKTYIGKYKNS